MSDYQYRVLTEGEAAAAVKRNKPNFGNYSPLCGVVTRI
jgi:hypothetical protein